MKRYIPTQYLVTKCRHCHRIIHFNMIDEMMIIRGAKIKDVYYGECRNKGQCDDFIKQTEIAWRNVI